jgi:putative flippase GtrA
MKKIYQNYKHTVLSVLGVVFGSKRLQGFYASSLFRFCIVGFLGTLTNLLVFSASHILLALAVTISSIIAFAVAVTQNYLFNHLWSFKKVTTGKPTVTNYVRYVFVNLFSLVLNLIVLNVLVSFSVNSILAQAVGVIAGIASNYAGSYFFVFMRKAETSL